MELWETAALEPALITRRAPPNRRAGGTTQSPPKASDAPTPGDRPFIVLTSSAKAADPATRKLIRSHVMRRHKSSVLAAKRDAKAQASAGDPKQDATPSPCPHPGLAALLSPFVSFAEPMHPYMWDLLNNSFLKLDQSQYPPSLCSMSHDDPMGVWIKFMAVDASYIHALVVAGAIYADFLRFGLMQMNKVARHHLTRALAGLQRRIEDRTHATSDSTLGTVITLACVASAMGDQPAARSHMAGIIRMVGLRGGIDNLDEIGHVRRKVCRLETLLAIRDGSRPVFYRTHLSWERCLPGPLELSEDLGIRSLISYFDRRLVNTWSDLRGFARGANMALHDSSKKYSPDDFQDFTSSIQYRLLHLAYKDQPLEEAMRLAMLVFVSSAVYYVQGGTISLDVTTRPLERALAELPVRPSPSSPLSRLVLWMHLGAATCSSDLQDRSWLQERTRSCVTNAGVNSWTQLRVILKNLIWIDNIHDRFGKEAYDLMIGEDSASE